MDEQMAALIEEEAERIATKDTLALVGFVLAVVGFLSGLVPYVAWPLDIVGIVLSVMGWQSKHWGGFAKAGVVIGALGFIGTSLLFLLGVITSLSQGGAS